MYLSLGQSIVMGHFRGEWESRLQEMKNAAPKFGPKTIEHYCNNDSLNTRYVYVE